MLSSEDEEEEGIRNHIIYDETNEDDEYDATQPEKQGSDTMAAGGSVRSF